jgi:pimeloyl-ACP methyl ester carboxylesterase
VTDATVHGDGIDIAVRDYGGTGSPILFIPGAGRSLVDIDPMAPHLTGSHRLVAMDVRGHGRSGDGPWTYEHVLNDIRAVIAHYALTDVTILGHSLGGMLAGMLTRSGEVKAGVNMDGHGMGSPELYDGYTVEQYDEMKAAMDALGKAQAGAKLSGAKLWLGRKLYVRMSLKQGFSRSQAAERVDRMLVPAPGGGVAPRPTPATATQMMAAIGDVDLVKLWEDTRAPLLVYNARQLGKLPRKLPPGTGDFLMAYRRGLRIALAGVAERNPLVQIQEIDASHDLHLERTAEVAQQVKDFIASS